MTYRQKIISDFVYSKTQPNGDNGYEIRVSFDGGVFCSQTVFPRGTVPYPEEMIKRHLIDRLTYAFKKELEKALDNDQQLEP